MTEKELTSLLKGQQLSEKSLIQKTESYTKEQKNELSQLLEHMMSQGVVGKHDQVYFLLKDSGIFLAKVTAKTHNFVILQAIPDGFEARISGEESDELLIGDLVYAKEFQQGVYHCLDYYKSTTSLKGRYSLTQNGKEQLLVDYLNKAGKNVLIADIDESLKGEIQQGDLLEGDIVSFHTSTIKVKITKILVKASSVGSDISMIISENNAPLTFPEEVEEEAKKIPQQLSEDDKKGRTDFRSHCVVTIDGDDAHDFDDAVEGRRSGNGYEIVVHIADVTEYMKPNHPIDDEAKTRGTSIYVADRVVPMIPFELSNGICSLNPDEERLVLSVTMYVDAQGFVYNTKIERGVIRSHGRLTYHQVNDFFSATDMELEKNEDLDSFKAEKERRIKETGLTQEIQDTLLVLREAAQAIRKRRTYQGAMRLDSTELKFKLDENGMPTEVEKVTQGESERMIEDLMIIANCSVAKALKKANVPVLYRVHEFPPRDRLSTFKDFLKKMGLISSFPKTENISGARLNDFLASISDKDVRSSVSYMMLRAMAKARYSPEELGHFGLAELEYCHFTSPIRRYPDDIIHRLVKDYLLDKKAFDYDEVYSYLEDWGDKLSDEEVRADSIEREVDDLESAKYMSQHIGELYHGKVVGMVQRGMFIETEIGIEGFLAYHCMHGDYFYYNDRFYEVDGKDTDISFSIGTPIDVKVMVANPREEEVDFATPEYYNEYCQGLSEEQREDLSLNGIHVYTNHDDDEYQEEKENAFEGDNTQMNEEKKENENKEVTEEDQNVEDALSMMDDTEKSLPEHEKKEDDDFRPTPEQWKKVDVIRAVVAMYPDDEEKVLKALAAMDISEEEYRKLLRFTKPREDRGGRDRRSSRGFHSHDDRRGFSHDRGGRDRGFRSDRGGYGHSDRDHRGFGRKDDRKGGYLTHNGYGAASERRPDKKSSRSFGKDDRRGFKGGRFQEDKPQKTYGNAGRSRGGYGRKKKES